MLDPLQIIQQYENGSGNPYLGTGGTDLTSYIDSGNVNQYGFPNWGGISTPAGQSTAAGLYQITQTNWDQWYPELGLSGGFTPANQAAVAGAMYNADGFAPWAPYNSNLSNAIAAAGGDSAFTQPGQYVVQAADATAADVSSATDAAGSTLTADTGGSSVDQQFGGAPLFGQPPNSTLFGQPGPGGTSMFGGGGSSSTFWESFIADAGNVMMRGGIILLAVALIAVAAAMTMRGEMSMQGMSA